MRPLALTVIVLLCSIASASAAELKIATWNIAWLNKDSDKGMVKRNDADYARLKAYADRLDADIVALEEVDGTAAAKRVFDPRKYTFHFEKRKSEQMVGFAIKKRLRFRNNADYAALSLNPGLRRGVDITVSVGRQKIRLLAVHLKSGCFDDRSKAQKDCDTLRRQVPILEQWIDARATEPLPFIVLGDFNRRLDKSNDSVWHEIDDADPPNADLTDEGAGRKHCAGTPNTPSTSTTSWRTCALRKWSWADHSSRCCTTRRLSTSASATIARSRSASPSRLLHPAA